MLLPPPYSHRLPRWQGALTTPFTSYEWHGAFSGEQNLVDTIDAQDIQLDYG